MRRVLFSIVLFCNAAAFRDVLHFVQKLHFPQYCSTIEHENYFNLSITDRTTRRIVEEKYQNYLRMHCFDVKDFALHLQDCSRGALQPLILNIKTDTLDLQSWEMVAFFEKTPLRNEYSRCLISREKDILSLPCVDKLIDSKLTGLHASLASLSLFYLTMARIIARDNSVRNFLTDFRLAIKGDGYLQELVEFFRKTMPQIKVDRNNFLAEVCYVMCMFSHVEYQAAFLRRFDICKQAELGYREIQIIFQKLQPTLVHSEDLSEIFRIMVRGILLKIEKIQITTVPQRSRVNREVAFLYFSPGLLTINISEHPIDLEVVLNNAWRNLRWTEDVTNNPTVIPLRL